MSKIDVIQRLFRRAAEENDGTRLIQAYTAETGIKILNQTFISTTRTRPIAEEYILDLNNGKKYKVMITFKICKIYTALNLENVSEFQHEEEI
ncbi:unnamed protein product [Rotaria socialis]|uniref:Uncharacterized protein n=1 Tax=Rotaria socialis TaxID=392032 RepID=A0A820VLR9_9BILA|nr:unnamed protein product [Rotaria socialis]CAF4502357.1 unnamed protein product [Rotaria socialis]